MKHLFVAVCAVSLVGCMTVPVVQNFPRANATLMTPAPALKEIPAGTSASSVFEIVIENYGTYNEVANQLQGWQQWYLQQKQIFESAK